jgi:hypothetical protein
VGSAFCHFVTLPSCETERHILSLNPALRVQKELQDIVTKASLSLAENGLDLVSVDQQRAFDVLFKSYVDRLSSVVTEKIGLPPTLYLQASTQLTS